MSGTCGLLVLERTVQTLETGRDMLSGHSNLWVMMEDVGGCSIQSGIEYEKR